MAVERSLILIKPDAVRRRLAAEILGRIEARGFTVRAGKLLTASRDLGETHYAEHREKPFFGELVEFITSGPTWALVVEGEGAIATMRATISATAAGSIGVSQYGQSCQSASSGCLQFEHACFSFVVQIGQTR